MSWLQEHQSRSCERKATSSSMTWCYVTLSQRCHSASQDKPLSCSPCEHKLTGSKFDSLGLARRRYTDCLKAEGWPLTLCFTLGTSCFWLQPQCESVRCVFGEQQVWRVKRSSREGNTQQDLGVWHWGLLDSASETIMWHADTSSVSCLSCYVCDRLGVLPD